MPTLHYIWWGPSAEALDPRPTRAVAESTIGTSMIHIWCQSETEGAIARAFDGLINVRVRGLGRDGVLPAWVNTKKGTPEPWETKLDGATASAVSRTVMHLSAHKGYSGVKDLLMLVVLYTEGGYYFDTTCFMAPVPLVRLHGRAAKTLAEALDTTAEYAKDASTRDIPRFPRIGRLRQWDRKDLEARGRAVTPVR